MVCAIILFSIWTAIVIGTGAVINYTASLSNITAVINSTGIIVLVLQIIGIFIGLFFVLLYAWSVKKSNQLEAFLNKKKIKTKNSMIKTKQQITETKKETEQKIKSWYDRQWFAIENESK